MKCPVQVMNICVLGVCILFLFLQFFDLILELSWQCSNIVFNLIIILYNDSGKMSQSQNNNGCPAYPSDCPGSCSALNAIGCPICTCAACKLLILFPQFCCNYTSTLLILFYARDDICQPLLDRIITLREQIWVHSTKLSPQITCLFKYLRQASKLYIWVRSIDFASLYEFSVIFCERLAFLCFSFYCDRYYFSILLGTVIVVVVVW